MITGIWIQAGAANLEPTYAGQTAAIRYWPSTPMLKRVIRKPTATARPAINSGTARVGMGTMPLTTARSGSPKARDEQRQGRVEHGNDAVDHRPLGLAEVEEGGERALGAAPRRDDRDAGDHDRQDDGGDGAGDRQ